MADEKDPNDPSNTSMAFDAMFPKWDMINTLLGGTAAMRDAGETYLPQHEAESHGNYQERLHTATLFNMTEITLMSLVGKPFSDPVILRDDVPAEIKAFEPDIDLQGNNLTTFARTFFQEGLAKAFAHCFIDMPALTAEEKAQRTKADDLAENRRPYWTLIKPENIIFASTDVVAGIETLTHVRFRENAIIRSGFVEVLKQRIRVFDKPVDGTNITWMLWELKDQNKKKKPKWEPIQNGTLDIDVIPLVTFYTNRTGLMEGKSPLEDLAYLNIRHWQSTSDQNNILTVSRFPILAGSGVGTEDGKGLAIGPRVMLYSKDSQGRFYYVEHTGAAIAAGRNDLLDLETQMSAYGAQFLQRKPGNPTATARALDSAEATSPLQDSAVRFIDVMNQCLKITAKWMGITTGGTVSINTEFKPATIDAGSLAILLAARKQGDLSREDFLKQLKEFEIIRDEFDPLVNLYRLMIEVKGNGLNPDLVDPLDITAPATVPSVPFIAAEVLSPAQANQAPQKSGLKP